MEPEVVRSAPGGTRPRARGPGGTSTGWPSTAASTSTPSPARSTNGARMNTAWNGPPSSAGDGEVGLEGVDLAAEGVAAHGDVDGAEAALVGPAVEDLGAEQDHPGAGAERRHARRRGARPAGSNSPDDSSSIDIVVDSPPGRTSASTSSSSAGVRTSTGSAPSVSERALVRGERALQGEDADLRPGTRGRLRTTGPTSRGRRAWSRACRSRGPASAAPRPRDTLARMSRIGEVRGGLDDGLGPARPGCRS